MANKIALLPGERIVMSSDKEILILTNKRVRYDSTAFGTSEFVSITLQSVASCALITRSFPILLVIAALAFLGGLYQGGDNRTVLIGAAVLCAIIYAATRRAIVSIASNGGASIDAPARSMGRASIIEFLEAVEREKLQ